MNLLTVGVALVIVGVACYVVMGVLLFIDYNRD